MISVISKCDCLKFEEKITFLFLYFEAIEAQRKLKSFNKWLRNPHN